MVSTSSDDTTSTDPPITITPASPVNPAFERQNHQGGNADGRNKLSLGRPRGQSSAGRRVSKILKTQVHRGQERISSISRIVAFGPRQGLGHLRKVTSAPGRYSLITHRFFINRFLQIFIPFSAQAPSRHHPFTHEDELRTGTLPPMNPPQKVHLPLPPRSRRSKHHQNGTAVRRRAGG